MASFFAAALMFAGGSHAATPRPWRSADGEYTFDASLAGLYGEIVDLLRGDGVGMRLPTPLLSQEDREFLKLVRETKIDLKGGGSVSSLLPGYSWRRGEVQGVGAKRADLYICQKPVVPVAVKLLVLPIAAESQAERRSVVQRQMREIEKAIKAMKVQDASWGVVRHQRGNPVDTPLHLQRQGPGHGRRLPR